MPSPFDEEELLAPADAAKILGLSADMVRLLAKHRHLPTAARSVRGVRLFRREDVVELAAARSGQIVPTHLVQFYRDDAFLAEAVAAYLGDGLRVGAKVVAIVTAPHREAVVERLTAGGTDVAGALADGHLVFFDAYATLNQLVDDGAGVPDAARFAEIVAPMVEPGPPSRQHGRVRVFGEMVDVLWKAGRREGAAKLEAMWNELAQARAFSLMCGYALDGFTGEGDVAAFERVCDAHTRVVPADGLGRSSGARTHEREMAQLQQRACSLQSEVEQRRRVEDALRVSQDELRRQNQRLADALRENDSFFAMLDIGEVVARGLELASPMLVGRAGDVVLRVKDGGRVDVDVDRMAQVVANLLSNAVKNSDAGTPIEISAHESDGTVVLRVADRGVGIARGGLDLGLAIVRGIVERHGGRVSAQSDGAGRGATITVELPAATATRR